MKTIYVLFFASISIVFFSCSENEYSESVNTISTYLSDELSTHLSEYEIIDVNVSALYNSVINQSTDIKQVSIIKGRLNFKVRPTSIEMNKQFLSLDGEVLTDDVELDKTLYLDNLDLDEAIVGMTLRESDMYVEYQEDGEQYVISPAKNFVEKADINTYILYPKTAMIESYEEGSDCLLLNHENNDLMIDTHAERAESRFAHYNVTITLVIDYAMKRQLGFWGAVNYVNDAMYWTNFRFRVWSGLPISIIKGSGYVLDQPGQYGLVSNYDSATYLNSFASWLSMHNIGNDAEILFTRDHAHWGAAWPYSICGYRANALIEYHSWHTRRYNIIAHEIGHILGAGHTNYGVMRTVADGVSRFTPYSKNQILSFLSYTNWCLF